MRAAFEPSAITTTICVILQRVLLCLLSCVTVRVEGKMHAAARTQVMQTSKLDVSHVALVARKTTHVGKILKLERVKF